MKRASHEGHVAGRREGSVGPTTAFSRCGGSVCRFRPVPKSYLRLIVGHPNGNIVAWVARTKELRMRTVARLFLFPPVGTGRPRRAAGAGLLAGVVASIGFTASPASALTVQTALSAPGPAPGTIFVANGGAGANGTGTGSVTLYRPGSNGDARPEAVVTDGIGQPDSPALDSSGNLWVANQGSGTVVEFAKAKMAKSGSPTPVFTLHENDCSVAVDSVGDLWGGSTSDSLSEWAKAHLTTAGSPLPEVAITSSSLNGPCKRASDRAGDIWAANYNSNTIVEFTKAQIAKSGSPSVQIDPYLAIMRPPSTAWLQSGVGTDSAGISVESFVRG
jgi:hypothetical protein